MSEQKEYYHNDMEEMRTFFKERAKYAVENMENYLGISNDSATVTVTRHGSGEVAVGSENADFSENLWTGFFDKGTKVTLTAKPAKGYVFAGWSGSVSSDSKKITVTADEASALVCSFKKAEYEQGDINSDGSINVTDLLLMSKYLHGTEELTEAQAGLADMNSDKAVDVFDLVELRRKLLSQAG
jgi:hypothetical protein